MLGFAALGEIALGGVPYAAQAYQLTAGAGSFALSWQGVTLTAARAVPAGQGAFARTGYAVSLKKGYRLPAEAGATSLSGQDAALLRGYRLAAGQGSFAENGQAAGFGLSRLFASSGASVALTGQDVGLHKGFYTGAGHGSFAVAGQDAVLRREARLAAGQGAFAVTGSVALEFGHRIYADKGDFSFSGQPVAFFTSRSAEAGMFAASGQAAVLRKTWRLIPQPHVGTAGNHLLASALGAHALGGVSVFGTALPTFNMTRQNAGVRAARRIYCGAGSFTIPPAAVILRRAAVLPAGHGSFAKTGQAVGLIWRPVLALGHGQFVLTGQAIEFLRTRVRVIGSVRGYAPVRGMVRGNTRVQARTLG
jgi:hypothetical protein